MIKSIYSNLLPKAVLLSVFLSPGYVISKAHANTDSISGIEQTNGKLSGRVIDAKGEPILRCKHIRQRHHHRYHYRHGR